MANYTKTTNFTSKDSLPSGDPNKLVKGVDFDTEFDAIAVASATKTDNASAAITGGTIDGAVIGGTTPAAVTTTALVATTADIDGGTVDGAVVGGTTPAAGTFTTLAANTSLTAATADIDGGTLDGATIGGTTPGAGTFTTLNATSATVTGDFTVDTNTLFVDSANNRIGILDLTPAVSLDISSATDAVGLPVGTTAQRPVTPATGMFRYNSSNQNFEGYDGSSWGSVGGASGGGGNPFIYENDTNVTVDYTITSGKNGLSAGPITIDSGITVTVPTGSVWTVV